MTSYFSDKKTYIAILWFLSILGSQFYIFDSGKIQPGYLPLLVLMFFSIFNLNKLEYYKIRAISYFFIFIIYSLFVNFIWLIIEQDDSFIDSSLYWLFGFLVLLSGLIYINSEKVVYFTKISALLSILFLFCSWVLGFGNYDVPPRYNGYFNDPNQMAFWVLCAFSIYFYLEIKNKRLVISALLLISGILVFATLSRSALLGFAFLVIGVAIRIQRFDVKINLSKRMLYFLLVAIFFALVFSYISTIDAYNNLIDRFLTSDFESQAEIRGYTRILVYPEYLFLGAGQGFDSRFNSIHEIHSSWAALFFYYGFLGLSIFLTFIFRIFLKLDLAGKFILLGPLVYGFSTYGLRSPIFWIFMAAAIYATRKYDGTNKI